MVVNPRQSLSDIQVVHCRLLFAHSLVLPSHFPLFISCLPDLFLEKRILFFNMAQLIISVYVEKHLKKMEEKVIVWSQKQMMKSCQKMMET